MLTCSCSAHSGGNSTIPHPSDSTSVISSEYLIHQCQNIYVPPSKWGTTPLSTSLGSLTPHGLSQGGGEELVSNSISKFQQLDFEISDSSLQSSTVLVDNFGYNSLLGITDFYVVGSASKTTVSDPLQASIPSMRKLLPNQSRNYW